MLMSKKLTIKAILLILIIPLIAEVFFFNFRFWESLFFKDISGYQVTTEANEVLIDGFDAPVRNIYIDTSNSGIDAEVIGVNLTISDEANTDLELSETEVVRSVVESNYLRIYPDGNVRKIKLVFDSNKVSDASGIDIKLNSTRPFGVHPARLLMIAVIVALVLIFKPGSKVYEIKLMGDNRKITDRNKIYLLLALLAMVGFWLAIVMAFHKDVAVYYFNGHVEAIYSYQAEAFLKGQVNLDFEPPKYLSEMANPYDYNARFALYQETGEGFKLDFAFFDGKYFSYYSVVPTLLMYLPFVALTGVPLNNSVPVFICGAVFMLFAFMLIHKMVRRYYSDISLGTYLILVLTFIFGTGVFYCAQTPSVYSVAFIYAIMFAVIALYFWMAASEKHFENSAKPLSKIRLVLGALAMGLAIGSRPVFGLYLFLIFPLFYKEIKEKHFFSRKGLGNTIAVIAPLLLIGAGLMYFNQIRFGSAFDFGNTYNLSEMDLEHRHLGINRLWIGIFEYLFQPLRFKGTFPYIDSVYNFSSQTTDYLGYLFFDPVYAGYFALCPISLVVVFIKKCKKELTDMRMYAFSILSLIFACGLILLVIEQTGMTMRYQMDFGMLIVLAAIPVLIALFRKTEKSAYKNAFKIILTIVLLLLAVTVFNNLIVMLAPDKMKPLASISPKIYYSIKYLVFAMR